MSIRSAGEGRETEAGAWDQPLIGTAGDLITADRVAGMEVMETFPQSGGIWMDVQVLPIGGHVRASLNIPSSAELMFTREFYNWDQADEELRQAAGVKDWVNTPVRALLDGAVFWYENQAVTVADVVIRASPTIIGQVEAVIERTDGEKIVMLPSHVVEVKPSE